MSKFKVKLKCELHVHHFASKVSKLISYQTIHYIPLIFFLVFSYLWISVSPVSLLQKLTLTKVAYEILTVTKVCHTSLFKVA